MMQHDWEREWVEYQSQQQSELQGQQQGHQTVEQAQPMPVFNLSFPASHCTACQTPLRARELVPVLSFLFLKGRCAHCHTAISWRYPLVELAVAALWACCAWRWGISAQALAWAGYATVLLALGLIDADTMLLPDSLTLPLMWAGLLLAAGGVISVSLEHSVWGAALGYLTLWLVQTVFGLVTGKQGMGQGDFKLLAALGAWLGWMALPAVVLCASVSGVGVALAMRWRGHLQAGQPLPFGPALVFAGLLFAFTSSSAWLIS